MPFIATRRIRVGGETLYAGDVAEGAEEWKNLRALINAGRLTFVGDTSELSKRTEVAAKRAKTRPVNRRDAIRDAGVDPRNADAPAPEATEVVDEVQDEVLPEDPAELLDDPESVDPDDLSEYGVEHVGAGWYRLPSGEKVRGREEALAALADEEE